MGEQAVQDWKEHNVAAYSAPAATEMYARNARERGLTRSERRVLNAFFTPSAGTVLDVGCGAGRTTSRIAERGFDVVGMDVSEEMVRTAADLYPRLDFQVGDAANCPFGDDRFEYVLFSACGLDYPFPEAERRSALLEFRRVLKPGGVLAFNTHNSWYALPALLLDRSYLKDVYLAASNLSRLHAPYKVFPQEFDVATYVSNPRRQRRELREAGFEFLSCVGKRPTLKYLERCPYFISRKPIGREGRGGRGVP